jgi:hypothetical protein
MKNIVAIRPDGSVIESQQFTDETKDSVMLAVSGNMRSAGISNHKTIEADDSDLQDYIMSH